MSSSRAPPHLRASANASKLALGSLTDFLSRLPRMKRKSLSQATNIMRRALRDLIDEVPSDAQQLLLREHFGHRCCYCGAPAPHGVGHIDHADPKRGNGIGNLLLACRTCNGNQKREMPWAEFLAVTIGTDVCLHAERDTRIRAWLETHRSEAIDVPADVAVALAEAQAAIAVYEQAYRWLRTTVNAARAHQTATHVKR